MLTVAANPARFMEYKPTQQQLQQHRQRRPQQTHQPYQERHVLHHQESSSTYSTALRHDHRGNGTPGALSSSSPQGLLGLSDLPHSAAAAAAIASALPRERRYPVGRPPSPSAVAAVESASSRSISNRAGRSQHGFAPPNMPPPVLPDAERSGNPRGLTPPAHHHHHHHHHPQQRHFSAPGGAAGRHLDGGGGGSGGLYGDDDNFDFLRTILLDAGDGSAQAAHHHHHQHNSALPSLGGAGAGYVPISTFAPISAAKSPAYAAAVTSAPQALHPALAPSSMASAAAVAAAGGRRFAAPSFGGSYSGGSASAGSAGGSASGSSSSGVVGAAGVAGYSRAGGGGNRGVYHATEEEKLQAADDIAGCVWLAGDEIREVLLARLWEVWGTAEADMVSMAAASEPSAGAAAEAIAAGMSCGGRASPSLAPPKSFNEVLMERLQATCKEVEAELKAATGRGDAAAFCGPPQQHWRGGADLREDILSRLEAFQTNAEEETRGMPGFSSIRRMNDPDEQQQQQRLRQRAVSAAGSASAAAAPARGAGVRGTAAPLSGGGSGGRSRGDLKQGSDGALDGTARVVKSELLMYGEGEGTTGGAATDAGNAATAPGGRGGAATRGRRTPSADAPGSSPAAAGGTVKRKRKRSGNGRRCKHEGCSLHPHFGLTRPEYCSKHKLPGMFNVKGRRCVHPECTRTPVYGKPGDPHPTYCAAHKLAGYVDIKNPTCREPTCFRQPSFGSATDRKATYCASHMLTGHVNVRRMLASFKAGNAGANAGGSAAAGSGSDGTSNLGGGLRGTKRRR